VTIAAGGAANGCGPANTGVSPITYQCKGVDTSDAGILGLGVRYANGPLYLAAVYHAKADDDSKKLKNLPDDDNSGYGAKAWGIGGSYDFKVVKVFAEYYREKANHNGLAYHDDNLGSDKTTAWSIGISAPVSSAGTVFAEYAQFKDSLGKGRYYRNLKDDDTGTLANTISGHVGSKAKGYSVGYNHALSKRTSLFAYASVIDNDKGINRSWAHSSSSTAVFGEKQTNFVTGIAHDF
jgi:predicted porin